MEESSSQCGWLTVNLLFLLPPRGSFIYLCCLCPVISYWTSVGGSFFLPLMGNGDKNRVDLIAYKYSSEGVGGGGVLIRRRRDDKCVLFSLCDIENRTILDDAIWGFVAVVCRSLSTSGRWYYVWSWKRSRVVIVSISLGENSERTGSMVLSIENTNVYEVVGIIWTWNHIKILFHAPDSLLQRSFDGIC